MNATVESGAAWAARCRVLARGWSPGVVVTVLGLTTWLDLMIVLLSRLPSTNFWWFVMLANLHRPLPNIKPYLEGSVGSVASNGGYLYIYKGDTLLHIAGIPSPNLLGERRQDTEVDNIGEFIDSEGNNYRIVIYSSAYGIEWFLEEYPEDEETLHQLHYEVQLNEY